MSNYDEDIVDGLMEIYERGDDAKYKNAITLNQSSVQLNSRMSLNEFWEEYRMMPQEALFLGMAYDGRPVLLNMDDKKISGIMAVSPDNVDDMFSNMVVFNNHIEYLIITNKIQNYRKTEKDNHAVSIYSDACSSFILAMANWIHSGNNPRTLLYIDCFDEIRDQLDFDSKQNLKWLLVNGGKKGLKIFAHQTKLQYDSWEECFRTKLFSTGNVNEYKVEEVGRGGRPSWVDFYVPV
jgi:hypothetical protein